MFSASKQDAESSAEQIAWDKKNRRSVFLAVFVVGLFLTVAVGVVAGAISAYVLPSLDLVGSDLPRDSAEFEAAQVAGGKALSIVFIVFLATLVLYWPLRLFGRYLDFKLGHRPPDGGWKTYPYKPISMTLEKISDTVWTAIVDKYEFKITTRLDKHLIGNDTLRIEIIEVTDHIENFVVTGHLNLDVAEFSDEWIENNISRVLEDQTNYFMEYDYSI